jgi:hypothetical protein
MFDKLNAMYYYFSQSGYTEKYMRLRKIILEKKYDDDYIFMSNREINKKYHSTKKKSRKNVEMINDIESNLNIDVINEINEIDDMNNNNDDDSECSHVVIDYQNHKNMDDSESNDNEFCHISMYDIV